MTPILYAAGICVLVLVAEWLHGRRMDAIKNLAFGGQARPRWWIKIVPLLRALSAGVAMWGLMTILLLPPRPLTSLHGQVQSQQVQANFRRIVILLDVSPSMHIRDAGGRAEMTRAEKAGELIEHMLSRVSTEQARVSVIGFYTDIKPIVLDSVDMNVVLHIVRDLPLDQAFDDGKTDLVGAVKKTFDMMNDWVADSTTLIIVSDGDTVPSTGLPQAPPAISRTLVLGLGSTSGGTFIDGHFSYQDASGLRELATRLGGSYQNSSIGEIPTDLLVGISGKVGRRVTFRFGLREYAIAAIAAGGLMLCIIPALLAIFGIKRGRDANGQKSHVLKKRQSPVQVAA